MDNNRYEETPKKQNIFVKILLMFTQYLKNLGYDFIQSFKYNNMKLAGILVALPGLLIGFFISAHSPVINELSFSYYQEEDGGEYDFTKDSSVATGEIANHTFNFSYNVDGKKIDLVMEKTKDITTNEGDYLEYQGSYEYKTISGDLSASDIEKLCVDIYSDGSASVIYKLTDDKYDTLVQANVKIENSKISFTYRFEKSVLDFDYTAICFFILMLFGILNVFTAVSMMGKKNLGSVVAATITTSIIIICGILYISTIFIYFQNLSINGGPIVRQETNPWVWDKNKIIAISTIILSMVSSLVGVILGYINYDRTFEKVDR